MNWFLIALSAPFLWALVNISDQYLVSKYSIGERGSGGLVLFSSLIGLVIAFSIFIFTRGLLSVPSLDIILLLFTGLLTILWVILYLYSLELEDVSRIVPWFLTVPIFGYFLGYLFLGERLTTIQQISSIVTLLGLCLISINFSDKTKHIFKWKPALYMTSACLILAVIGIIFKYVTIEGDFWVSSFWQYVGLGTTGIIFYFSIPKYRREFLHMNRKGGKKIITLNIFSELLSVSGNLLTNFAILLAPVTVVYLVGAFQPVILFIMTLIGTHFYPNIIKEDLSRKVLIPKIIAIIVMITGSAMLLL